MNNQAPKNITGDDIEKFEFPKINKEEIIEDNNEIKQSAQEVKFNFERFTTHTVLTITAKISDVFKDTFEVDGAGNVIGNVDVTYKTLKYWLQKISDELDKQKQQGELE